MFLLFFTIIGGLFMEKLHAKFCSMSTEFGTINLTLLDIDLDLLDNFNVFSVCDIFIVPKNKALPGLRFFLSFYFKDGLFAVPLEKDAVSPQISLPMDTPDCTVIELDVLDFSSIAEIERITREAIKWGKEWKHVTLPYNSIEEFYTATSRSSI